MAEAFGYTRTAIRSTAGLAVDNLDVESVFSDDGITEADHRSCRRHQGPPAGLVIAQAQRHHWRRLYLIRKERCR